ncbi:MAG: cytochrome c family protein [Bacteroidales bacterium]|nr:cytochrome c family protein [Bacteroidales bacterium]
MNLKKLLLIVCSVFLVVSLTKAQDHEYIGAAKCKMCHNKEVKGKQYDVWKEKSHANAYETLASEEAKKFSADAQNDPKCLKCHSTYHSASADLMATIKAEEGVSCESCHGPGSVYKSMSIMKDHQKSLDNGLIIPTEALCKTCHNEESPTYKVFNYKEALAKIAHPNPLSE